LKSGAVLLQIIPRIFVEGLIFTFHIGSVSRWFPNVDSEGANLSLSPMQNLTQRNFAKIAATIGALGLVLAATDLAASAAKAADPTSATPASTQPAPRSTQDDKLQSEFLFDLNLEAQTPHNLGSAGGGRLIVPVSGGTFAGPNLKGTIVAPGGDWIVQRPDGSRVLDVRIVLQTDDGQKIYMSWRGIAYAAPGGTLFARILPMFETAAAKYAWLNNVVAVGVYRPDLGKIAYRVYRIL
jgi:hypothetical protein